MDLSSHSTDWPLASSHRCVCLGVPLAVVTTRPFTSALDPLLLFLLSRMWYWVGLRAKVPFTGPGCRRKTPGIGYLSSCSNMISASEIEPWVERGLFSLLPVPGSGMDNLQNILTWELSVLWVHRPPVYGPQVAVSYPQFQGGSAWEQQVLNYFLPLFTRSSVPLPQGPSLSGFRQHLCRGNPRDSPSSGAEVGSRPCPALQPVIKEPDSGN